MEIIQLNEEIKVKCDQLEVILLIDYKRKAYEIFKHYEDKNFSSSEVVKYKDILNECNKIADARLHPDEKAIKEAKMEAATPARVKVKPEILEVRMGEKLKITEGRTIKKITDIKEKIHRTYAERVCVKCNETYTPTGVTQKYCKKCKP